MEALAMGTSPKTTGEWVGVLALDMDDASAQTLYDRVQDRDDPLTGLRIEVLWNQLCLDAFGITAAAAQSLAATYCSGWFPFLAWANRKGLRVHEMTPADILTAVYAARVDSCEKEDDIAKMNRQIFRSSNPWG